jgi:hypothetical protein
MQVKHINTPLHTALVTLVYDLFHLSGPYAVVTFLRKKGMHDVGLHLLVEVATPQSEALLHPDAQLKVTLTPIGERQAMRCSAGAVRCE